MFWHVLEWFYGDKYVHYRALKETIPKTWKHIQKIRNWVDFGGKESANNGAKCWLDFLGVVVVAV